MSVDELYRNVILDHNKNPKNYGELKDFSHFCEGYNPLCGDQFYIYINVLNDKIIDISFKGEGCAISKASASLMTEKIKGITIKEAYKIFELFRNLTKGERIEEESLKSLGKISILKGVSQYPARVKCAMLAWHTFIAAIKENSILKVEES